MKTLDFLKCNEIIRVHLSNLALALWDRSLEGAGVKMLSFNYRSYLRSIAGVRVKRGTFKRNTDRVKAKKVTGLFYSAQDKLPGGRGPWDGGWS